MYLFASKTTAMPAPAHSPLHKEISRLALFISLPQLIASPTAVGIYHLIYSHNSSLFEVKEVFDFLLISFPLTLSVALIVLLLENGRLNPITLFLTIVGAALLSNFFHYIFAEIPSVDLENTFTNTFNNPENNDSSNLLFQVIGKIFGIYWKTFGPILFIQSCGIGIYAAVKYLKIEKDNKNTKK